MRPIWLLPLALLVAGLLAIPSTASAVTVSCSGSLSGGFWTHITANQHHLRQREVADPALDPPGELRRG